MTASPALGLLSQAHDRSKGATPGAPGDADTEPGNEKEVSMDENEIPGPMNQPERPAPEPVESADPGAPVEGETPPDPNQERLV